ncbi:3-methyladenine DNA glycosylase AlkD [Formosa sp. Hel1_31_208]|uniref:DNA alkylation repair protein n=1 Tax=Formosa sp. Hel1_31_208 TaxID=1798225 RepID=UPI00087B820E|nr:DNA alkylation repair protein [Formosa sp. Hel1_31_208]SDS00833.1 3-methyladenine DNA glycosylase AlkD [Formosa sp. Hel1_31_208]
MKIIERLIEQFQHHTNPDIAQQQKAYMRNQFEFFGLKSTLRKEIQKPFLSAKALPPKSELEAIVYQLWQQPQRECQYAAQEFANKYVKHIAVKDIELYEHMVTHKSWWDTVDFIANNLMGHYFKLHPELRQVYIDKWLISDNIWLQRCAILFQLKYKDDLDTVLLAYIINSLLGSKEFFINKAIGWILREYSRTNPSWVIEFVAKTNLSPLSHKEALRLIPK